MITSKRYMAENLNSQYYSLSDLLSSLIEVQTVLQEELRCCIPICVTLFAYFGVTCSCNSVLVDLQITWSKTSASYSHAAFVLVQFICLHVDKATIFRLYQIMLYYL